MHSYILYLAFTMKSEQMLSALLYFLLCYYFVILLSWQQNEQNVCYHYTKLCAINKLFYYMEGTGQAFEEISYVYIKLYFIKFR